jgi:hypothetical protein
VKILATKEHMERRGHGVQSGEAGLFATKEHKMATASEAYEAPIGARKIFTGRLAQLCVPSWLKTSVVKNSSE